MKCKFCKNEPIISIKKYGYKGFSVCKECLHWVLIELDNIKEDLEEKEE